MPKDPVERLAAFAVSYVLSILPGPNRVIYILLHKAVVEKLAEHKAMQQNFSDDHKNDQPAVNQTDDELELAKVEQYLDRKEKEITVLERASQLQKRFWRYERSDVAQTWITRWITTPVIYLFPRERREECFGDLCQINTELLNQGYPRWLINLINVGNTIVLVVSALSIKVSDLISFALQRQK